MLQKSCCIVLDGDMYRSKNMLMTLILQKKHISISPLLYSTISYIIHSYNIYSYIYIRLISYWFVFSFIFLWLQCHRIRFRSPIFCSFPFTVHGNWSLWSSWSSCNRPCGTGERSRDRVCDSPSPEFGGDDCEGDAEDTTPCNTHPCKREWGNYFDVLCLNVDESVSNIIESLFHCFLFLMWDNLFVTRQVFIL